MNTEADRARFEQMAADYQSELDAAKAAHGEPSGAPTTAPEDAAPTDDAAAAQPQSGGSDTTAPAPSSEDEQEPTRD